MRKTLALGLVLAAAIATPALAQSFVGDWTATAHTPGGDVSETLNVTKAGAGYVVNAKLVGQGAGGPEAGPGTNVVLDGDKFSYKRSLTMQGGATVDIVYSGVVTGDTFTGAAEVAGSKVPYTGVRISAAK